MFGQNTINIPLAAAKDTEEDRIDLGKRLMRHASDVVEIVATLPPAEQQAVLEMAKQIVIANNQRLYDLTMKSAEGQAQTMLGNMFGGMVNPNDALPIQRGSKQGVSWLGEALNDDLAEASKAEEDKP